MKYIEQPRGPGTAYRFRMKTPKRLLGKVPPWSKTPLKSWIIRGFDGEKHLPSAKKKRDIFLAEVRKFEASLDRRSRFSFENAERWHESLKTEDDEEKAFISGLLRDHIERAPKDVREAFRMVALEGTLSLAMAHERYVAARQPANGFGYQPLGQTSLNDLQTAIRYLSAFYEKPAEKLLLSEVTKKDILQFRGEFLPAQRSKRTGSGLALATIEKMNSMLRGLWAWAIEQEKVPSKENPFELVRGVRRQRRKVTEKNIDMYQPEEVSALFLYVPAGHRMGDLMRLALVTGARQTELVKARLVDVTAARDAIMIEGGKTENARRFLPIPLVARELFLRLVADAEAAGSDRLFGMFALKHSSGNASSASKSFTALRRRVLGPETDGRLNFHSFRHTWKTNARRAGVPIEDTHDLGGWAGVKRSSDPYDHGLLPEALAEAQEQIAQHMGGMGYLERF